MVGGGHCPMLSGSVGWFLANTLGVLLPWGAGDSPSMVCQADMESLPSTPQKQLPQTCPSQGHIARG